jgi:hypothetical protein
MFNSCMILSTKITIVLINSRNRKCLKRLKILVQNKLMYTKDIFVIKKDIGIKKS